MCPIFKGRIQLPPSLWQFQKALLALSKVHVHIWTLLKKIHKGQENGKIPSHNIGPGDWVWVKRHQVKTLEPRWKGPYVVLTTPTALKVDSIGPWVRCNHVRSATPEEQEKAPQNERWHHIPPTP